MKPFLTLWALLALLAGCSDKQSTVPPDIRPVRAEQVGAAAANAVERYAGEVRARYETPLAFRVGGRVDRRQVDVGSEVKRGQVLATLEPQDYTLALRAVQAQLASAEAEARLAQQDLQRFTELRARNFIAEAELDRRRTVAEAAQARVRQLRAETSRLSNQEAYTRLVAPHAGLVTALSFETGQVVAAGQPVAQLARAGEREVRIDVPENARETLRAADTVRIRLWAVPDKTYTGRLRELSPTADAATRTYSARVSLLQPDASVQLGMTATVEVSRTTVNALSVSQTALFRVNGAPQVWVVDRASGKVTSRAVQLGPLEGERARIVSGLRAGEWVVTAGVHKLAPGQQVRLTAP